MFSCHYLNDLRLNVYLHTQEESQSDSTQLHVYLVNERGYQLCLTFKSAYKGQISSAVKAIVGIERWKMTLLSILQSKNYALSVAIDSTAAVNKAN